MTGCGFAECELRRALAAVRAQRWAMDPASRACGETARFAPAKDFPPLGWPTEPALRFRDPFPVQARSRATPQQELQIAATQAAAPRAARPAPASPFFPGPRSC